VVNGAGGGALRYAYNAGLLASAENLWVDGTNGLAFGTSGNAGVTIFTNGISSVAITNDGRLYGTALHNNAGAVTGTTNQYIASGTYTPTFTAVSGLSSFSAGSFQWIRVGNVVNVSGGFTATAAATTTIDFGLSLPIASNFTSYGHGAGSGRQVTDTENVGFGLSADTTNDRMSATGITNNSGSKTWVVSFTYLVV
jgi:hypothetical protein